MKEWLAVMIVSHYRQTATYGIHHQSDTKHNTQKKRPPKSWGAPSSFQNNHHTPAIPVAYPAF